MELSDLIAGDPVSAKIRIGTVVSVQATTPRTFTITLGSSANSIAGVSCLAQAFPAPQQQVIVLIQGTQAVILGSTQPSPYKARAHASGATSLTPAGFTTITLGVEDYDPNNNFAASTYTCPVDGYYRIDFQVEALLNNNPQDFVAGAFKNGTEVSRGSGLVDRGGLGSDALRSHGSDLIQCVTGDTITIMAYNTGANAINTAAGTAITFLTVALFST